MIKVFVGASEVLDKRWVIKARDVEDATGKVISLCRSQLVELEESSPNQDIDVDLSFTEVTDYIMEI